MAIAEIPVLCDQDSAFLVSEGREHCVGGALPWASSEVWTASCPAAVSCRASVSGSWASTTNFTQRPGHHTALARNQRAELERGEQVVTFEIGMVLDNLVDAHPRCQQLQQALDRVAQPAHRRLAVADGRSVVILSSRDIWAMVPPAAAAARYREGTPWSASRRSGKPVIVALWAFNNVYTAGMTVYNPGR